MSTGVNQNVLNSDEATALIAKLDGEFISGATNVTPDTEDGFAHTLGRIPKGYIVVSVDKAGSIYDGSTANTDALLYLQGSITAMAFKVYVF